jgi:hypothetical protein
MAKKTTRSTAGKKSSKTIQSRNYRNYRDTLLEWSERPAVRYVAGGMGIALLARLAYEMSDRYPQVSRFFKENLDTIEDKLKEFRKIDSGEETEARH